MSSDKRNRPLLAVDRSRATSLASLEVSVLCIPSVDFLTRALHPDAVFLPAGACSQNTNILALDSARV